MLVLANSSRASSSMLCKLTVATLTKESRRTYAKEVPDGTGLQRSEGASPNSGRDKMTKIMFGSRRMKPKLGAFQRMSPGELRHEALQEGVDHVLKAPIFLPHEVTPEDVGKAFKYSGESLVRFHDHGVPKNLAVEQYRLLSNPATVIRDVSVEVFEYLNKAKTRSSAHSGAILAGPPGCGKSTLLLQMLEYCHHNQWLMLFIPRAISLVNSTTTHIYDPRTQTYRQPDFSAQVLKRFFSVNRHLLDSMSTEDQIALERRQPVPAGTSFADLVNLGVREPTIAPTILEGMLTELSKHSSQHPVLIAVDDVQALYSLSMYRDPHYQRIWSYHLSLPRMLLDYASGKRSLTRGAFVGAISTSNTAFKLPLELRETLNLPYDGPTNAYARRNPILQGYTKGLRAIEVPNGLTLREAAAVFELWKNDLALVNSEDDDAFLARYAETGGNAREFVWKGLLQSIAL